MAFRFLGRLVARSWAVIPLLWIAAYVALDNTAPAWNSVVQDGEFAYLPPDAPSLVGEGVFQESFTRDFLRSSIAIVVRRKPRDVDGEVRGLITPEEDPEQNDYRFLDEILIPRVRDLLVEKGWMAADAEGFVAPDEAGEAVAEAAVPEGTPPPASEGVDVGRVHEFIPTDREGNIVGGMSTYADPGVGDLLVSNDGAAVLTVLNLETEYQEYANKPVVLELARLIDPEDGTLRKEKLIPPGIDLYLSGSAVIGNDLRQGRDDSGKSIDWYSALLVVVLLVAIYRAPLLAVIPLVTVFVSVRCSIWLLSFAADAGWIALFSSSKTYITVVSYGAGIDYCMFLMSRYREELHKGHGYSESIARSIGSVGPALAASAGTTMVGLGMMIFAEFGKFRQAGIGMSFSLFVVVISSLTFAPALLRIFGKYAFWPQIPNETIDPGGLMRPVTLFSRLKSLTAGLSDFWPRTAESLKAAPGRWLAATLVAMAPFAVAGVLWQNWLTYGLLSELSKDKLSVRGATAVREHFPGGYAAPVTALISVDASSQVDFRDRVSNFGANRIAELTTAIWQEKDDLGLADIRSVSAPLGVVRLDGLGPVARRIAIRRAIKYSDLYVSDAVAEDGGPLPAGVSKDDDAARSLVTRLDLIYEDGPFEPSSIAGLDALRERLDANMPAELREAGAEVHLIGPTASIRDLQTVTGRDQITIDVLVLLGVFAVLVLLLRNLPIATYLIVTVFFSFLVTLGVTYCVFAILPQTGLTTATEFPGLDWKVPIFLFTILVAVGEDYNIYLVTRIAEEQRRRGLVDGITSGLAKTGGIISGCGMIMAGTFSALMTGELTGMIQLGFALTFGVLLDTFVVRPILVPAYLFMLYEGRFGPLGKFLGGNGPVAPAEHDPYADDPPADAETFRPAGDADPPSNTAVAARG